jgi:hypothetical protein
VPDGPGPVQTNQTCSREIVRFLLHRTLPRLDAQPLSRNAAAQPS